MKNYLVTFYPEADLNSKFAVAIRTELEHISPKKWVQIFPFQIAIQTELSISELSKKLANVQNPQRISIVRFDEWFVNEDRFDKSLEENNY